MLAKPAENFHARNRWWVTDNPVGDTRLRYFGIDISSRLSFGNEYMPRQGPAAMGIGNKRALLARLIIGEAWLISHEGRLG